MSKITQTQKRIIAIRKKIQKEAFEKEAVKAVLKDIKEHFSAKTVKKNSGGWPLTYQSYRQDLLAAGADPWFADSLIYKIGLRIKYCPKRMCLVIVK